MKFELFDPKAGVRIRRSRLPHWYQPGVTYFVTFRTHDSVPQALLRSWHARREQWLRQNGIDSSSPSWKSHLHKSAQLERDYHAIFTQRFMAYLDQGLGACVLRQGNLARLVAECLRRFDGERYHLGDSVVMPNHVHVLTCLLGSTDLASQCRSWKKNSAIEVNKALGRKGRFWQEESFDHLVRSPEQFTYLQRYIADNPHKARLRTGEYLLYRAK